ncbi:hypothetical protein AYI68_g2278 [Smittium mucronatum]|uniref:Uncharacterized protein n=1 Tax=Smittium mucronatum TaxID=133383 RepID=A0A1R0H354_9FUNG|nr:hypothetical protein AYI68_g2278 [Smittium mucronatum]
MSKCIVRPSSDWTEESLSLNSSFEKSLLLFAISLTILSCSCIVRRRFLFDEVDSETSLVTSSVTISESTSSTSKEDC